MNDLKIGDRVRVVSVPSLFKSRDDEIKIGTKGIVKHLRKTDVGVEFDEYINGHDGWWGGKYGYCWYVPYERLEKIEDTEEETKEETREEAKEEVTEETKEKTFEQKILEVLREEIGVAEGEGFDVYKKGNMLWRCKFEENGFFRRGWDEFQKSGVWKRIICDFHEYTFKRKPFIPKYGERYFSLAGERDKNENIKFRVLRNVWEDSIVDYSMLALGNVFRSEKEALKNKDKVLEKLKKLQKGEV